MAAFVDRECSDGEGNDNDEVEENEGDANSGIDDSEQDHNAVSDHQQWDEARRAKRDKHELGTQKKRKRSRAQDHDENPKSPQESDAEYYDVSQIQQSQEAEELKVSFNSQRDEPVLLMPPVSEETKELQENFCQLVDNENPSHVIDRWDAPNLARYVDMIVKLTRIVVQTQTYRSFFRLSENKSLWTAENLQLVIQCKFMRAVCCLEVRYLELSRTHPELCRLQSCFTELKSFLRIGFDTMSFQLAEANHLKRNFALVDSLHVDIRNEADLSPTQRIVLQLLRGLAAYRYKRYKGTCYTEVKIGLLKSPDGNVFYMDMTAFTDNTWEEGIPGCELLMELATGAWKHVKTIKQFIYDTVSPETNFAVWTDLPLRMDGLLDYLQYGTFVAFQELQPKRECRAFLNGVLDLTFGCPEFTNYESEASYDPSCKLYDLEFPMPLTCYTHWYDIPTPHFEAILDHQAFSPQVKYWVYAMFGRLLYPLAKHDHWDCILFGMGCAGSGKTTMGKVASRFFNSEDVGEMSSNIEDKFGLAALYDKMMYVCNEVTKSWSLNRADTQSLISAGNILLCYKFAMAKTVKWDVPGLFFGNEPGSWLDLSGAMARRLLLLIFTKPIFLEASIDKLLDEESPAMLFKCYLAYAFAVQENPEEKHIWERVPQYFRDRRQDFSRDMNPVKEFIFNSDKVHYDPGNEDAMISLSYFRTLLINDFKECGRKMTLTISQIEEVLTSLNIKFVDGGKEVDGKKSFGKHCVGLCCKDPAKHVSISRHNLNTQDAAETKTFKQSMPYPPRSVAAHYFCDRYVKVCENCT
jgi:hypothetical protein